MKRFYRIAAIIAVAAIAASCSEKQETTKDVINFSATTGVNTKVTYSGVQVSGRERVDWKDGDRIWIWCPEASFPDTRNSAYFIGNIESDGYYSKGEIIPYSVDNIPQGLQWNKQNVTHHFYCIYPDVSQNSSVSLTYADSNAEASFAASVPASQPPLSVTKDADDNWVAAPDGYNLIMTATATSDKKRTVQLDFYPEVTAIEFTLQNGFVDHSDMTVSSITLTAETSEIVGDFSSTFNSNATSYSNAALELTVPFSTPATVAYGKTLKFTVFMLGSDDPTAAAINNLTIKISKDASTSISAFLETTTGPMTFDRSKKYFVSGLAVPGSCKWIMSAEPITVTPWSQEDITVDVE